MCSFSWPWFAAWLFCYHFDGKRITSLIRGVNCTLCTRNLILQVHQTSARCIANRWESSYQFEKAEIVQGFLHFNRLFLSHQGPCVSSESKYLANYNFVSETLWFAWWHYSSFEKQMALPFQYDWLHELSLQVATFIFFILTGYKFRPASENPYFHVPEEDDMDMDIV